MPPFRLDLTVWVLRRRSQNAWDRWDTQTYRRVLTIGDRSVEVAVAQTGSLDAPLLQVIATSVELPPHTMAAVTFALERLLGLQIDLTAFYAFAAADRSLAPLAQTFRGFKPPRFLSLFEALVNAISCQQLTLTVGIQLQNRLSERYGAYFPTADSIDHAFPKPEDVVGEDVEALRALGYSRQKAQYILELARALTATGLDFDLLDPLENEAVLNVLMGLHGVGRWSAEYVLLRGMGRLNVFPGDDVGAHNNLTRWLHLSDPLDYVGLQRLVSCWQPYTGLLYFHLLLSRLSEAGHFEA